MIYCPECGHKIESRDVNFCPECGTKVEWDIPAVDKATDHSSSPKSAGIRGLLFTNLNLLSRKLGVEEQDTRAVFDEFIRGKQESGVVYKLVDAGNYVYRKGGFLGRNRTVHLKSNSSLWDYMEILMDVHERETEEETDVSEYLFIIGGNDIIPMPCIRHYMREGSCDDTIDTDLLYAYPYGEKMLALLENQEAFKYDQLFFVGRLPLGEDATYDEWRDYMRLDVANSGGIPMTAAYGQCDPNWKNVSVRVASDLLNGNYLRDFEGRLSDEYYYHRMILSPMVVEGNVSQVFHTGASLYYYNLHGGEGKELCGYFGAMLHRNEEGTYPVIAPEHMMTCQTPNVVVSEACYGGRFIGLDKYHSMLLASLSTKTLVFVGSSRVAWGAVDRLNATPSTVSLSAADVIASEFMHGVLQGCTVAQALFNARGALMRGSEPGCPYTALTIVEFNLFGDPTVAMASCGGGKSGSKIAGNTVLASKDAPLGCTVERIEPGNQEGTLLEQVRGAVNSNMLQIRTIIDKYLYANYGVQPRAVDGILKMKYKDGREELQFNYSTTAPEGKIPVRYAVTTTVDGEVKRVYSTK